MIRGDEMQSQRGSVTVIAIAMLLFLMLIAVAWLPMMTMEKQRHLQIIGNSRPGMPLKPAINVLWHNWKQAILYGRIG